MSVNPLSDPLDHASSRRRSSFSATSPPSSPPQSASLKKVFGSTDPFDLSAGPGSEQRRLDVLQSWDTLSATGSLVLEHDLGTTSVLEEARAGGDVASKHSGSVYDVSRVNAPSTRVDPSAVLEVVEDISPEMRAKIRRQGRVHFVVLCWVLFLNGWNDGSAGPLIPTIQRVYHVDFAIVSLIFVCNCVGFIAGALANVWLADRVGFGKAMFLGASSTTIAYAIQAPAPSFPVLAAAYVISGFGLSILNASANGFVGSLKEHVSTKLSFIHASYGIGAFAAPLAATHFASQRRWSFHFLVSLGISVIALTLVGVVYRFRTLTQLLRESGHAESAEGNSSDSKYSQIFRIKLVHLLALFALVYVGTEVTLGGWIVTFIIEKRGGGPSAGYVSSGFFGGLALGRVLLIGVNRLVGPRRALMIYVTLSIALQITVWRVPSLVENAVAVSVIGLLFGPMYPILMNHASRVMPKWLLTGSLGWIGGVGNTGSAVLPFITGILAARFGINSLQPFLVAMMILLFCVWAAVPKSPRRPE